MGYKPDPTEEPPVFAPVPKPPLPPPGEQDPNEEECVYFFFQPVKDPVSDAIIKKPPEKGMFRFGDRLPPVVSQAIACDDVDPFKVTPLKMCLIPTNAGQGQNSVIFCGSLFLEDLSTLFDIGTASDSPIVSPRILAFLADLASRLGIATDDPYLLFREYDFYPTEDCADCQVWVVGCISESGDQLFSSHCGTTPAIMPASLVVNGKAKLADGDKDFSNVQRFEGPGAYASAQAFYQTIGQSDTWKCKDEEFRCDHCCSYCVGQHYPTEKACECNCLPEELRPDDCCDETVCVGECVWDGTGGNEWDQIVPCPPIDPITDTSETTCCICDLPEYLWNNIGVVRNMPCYPNPINFNTP